MDENEKTDTQELEEVETAIPFNFSPVKELPRRKYKKGSKYDIVLDTFLKGEDKLVDCSVTGKDANYMRTQLNKRIEVRKLKVKVSVTNNRLFLEKK